MRIPPHGPPPVKVPAPEMAQFIARLVATPKATPISETAEGRLERLAARPLDLAAALKIPVLVAMPPVVQTAVRAQASVTTAFLDRPREAPAAATFQPRPRATVLRELRATAPSVAVMAPVMPDSPKPFAPSPDDVSDAITAESVVLPPFSSFRDVAAWTATTVVGHGAVPLLALLCGFATALALWLVI